MRVRSGNIRTVLTETEASSSRRDSGNFEVGEIPLVGCGSGLASASENQASMVWHHVISEPQGLKAVVAARHLLFILAFQRVRARYPSAFVPGLTARPRPLSSRKPPGRFSCSEACTTCPIDTTGNAESTAFYRLS